MITAALSVSWVLSLITAMASKEPAALPWADQLPAEAEAIAAEASSHPLPGVTPAFTAALDTVMGWHESRFNPQATHDQGSGYGLFGTHGSTLGREVPKDLLGQVGALHELMSMSFRICQARPLEERAGWYAAGGEGCERRLGLSRARVWEAQRLLRSHPPAADVVASR